LIGSEATSDGWSEAFFSKIFILPSCKTNNLLLVASLQAYFDVMLDIVAAESKKASRLTSFLPFPFSVPSYRVNLRLLNAVLELTGDSEPTQASRRQNLAITLNQIKNYRGGIKSLYRDAARKSGRIISMEEMLKRTPEGLETPKYSVLKRDNGKQYETREYEDYSVCSLIYEGGPRGFQSLAGYIFGKNKEEKVRGERAKRV